MAMAASLDSFFYKAAQSTGAQLSKNQSLRKFEVQQVVMDYELQGVFLWKTMQDKKKPQETK